MLAAANSLPENILIQPVVVPELELRHIERHVLAARDAHRRVGVVGEYARPGHGDRILPHAAALPHGLAESARRAGLRRL